MPRPRTRNRTNSTYSAKITRGMLPMISMIFHVNKAVCHTFGGRKFQPANPPTPYLCGSYCWWFRNPARKPPFGCIKLVVNTGINYQAQLFHQQYHKSSPEFPPCFCGHLPRENDQLLQHQLQPLLSEPRVFYPKNPKCSLYKRNWYPNRFLRYRYLPSNMVMLGIYLKIRKGSLASSWP